MTNPFRGLTAYTRRDREVLFGREDDLTLILARLFTRRTTLLFAGSGVGKTSFLQAKVIPEIDDRYVVIYHDTWASTDPLPALGGSIAKELTDGKWSGGPAAGTTLLEKLGRLKMTRAGTQGETIAASGLVVVLDQFEEVFQHYRGTVAFDQFVRELADVVLDETAEIRIVFSMREEFLGELSVFDNKIPDPLANYYRLKSPTRRQGESIIRLTAASVGVTTSAFVKPLVEDLLDTSPEGSRATTHRSKEFIPPPYLQIACQRLWDTEPPTAESGFPVSYSRGAAANALRDYCNEHLNALDAASQQHVARAFGFLITRQGAKMAYEVNSLAEHMGVPRDELQRALDALEKKNVRILRRAPAPGNEVWYELYHDMYAPSLSAWKEHYERTRQEELERARQLAEARRWQGYGTAVAVAVLALMGGWIAYGVFSKTNADLDRTNTVLEQRLEAQAILDTARDQLRTDAERATLLALAALRDTQQQFAPGTAEQILTAAIRAPRVTATGTAAPVQPPPDGEARVSAQLGSLTVTGGEDGSLEWRRPGEQAAVIKVADSAISSLAFDDSGTVLMAGLDSGPALWIRVATRGVTAICPGQAGDAAGVAFSQGYTPQTISREGRVRTWTRGIELPSASVSSGAINSVAFSPTGDMAAAGGASRLVLLLSATTFAIQKSLENQPVRAGAVQEVAWSPDGNTIAAVHNDGLLNFWTTTGVNVDSASYRRTLWTASWRPDGKAVAVGSTEGAVYVVPFPVPRTSPGVPFRHKQRVVSVRYSPKGDFIASSGWDNTLQFTPLADGVRVRSIDGAGVIPDLAFGPAPYIAAANWNGSVMVYDYTTGATVRTFQGHNGPVTAIAFHPNGNQIASGGKDGTVRIWDANSGTQLLLYAEHAGTVTDLAYTQDGNRLVSAGADGFVRTWATSASDLIALARQTLSRDLTDAECQRYLGRQQGCGEYGSLRAR